MARARKKSGGGLGGFMLGFLMALLLAAVALFVYFRSQAPRRQVARLPRPLKNLVQLARYNFRILCSQVVEIGGSLSTLFGAQVGEYGHAGHCVGCRQCFFPAGIVFGLVVVIASDYDRFVGVALMQRRGDRKEVAGVVCG